MYKDQLNERHQFNYPPLIRLIKIILKHKDFQKVDSAAQWLGTSLKNSFHDNVLGPTSPSIPRIRNQHIKTLLIKLPNNKRLDESKDVIQKIKNSFHSIANFRSVRLIIDVDCY